MLGATLRDQLVKQFMGINCIVGRAPRIVWSSDRIEIDGQLLSSLFSAGPELTDSAINVISDRARLIIDCIDSYSLCVIFRMEWLNFHHLRYFWTVAKTESVRKAAEQLHVSQPSISAQLKLWRRR